MKSISEIIKDEKTWFQIFDIIRIIEPGGTHRVISSQGKHECDLNLPCYSFWGRNEHCVNCISKRSYMKHESVIKMDCCNNQYYIAAAKPIKIDEKEYILELLLNITDQIKNDEEDSYMKQCMADIAEKLESAASRDTFTSLYNKKYMQETYEKLQSEDDRTKLFMALFDMDNFKMVNDCYGHDQGDVVIMEAASILKNEISSEEGIAARFGGDEFGIVFISEDEAICRAKVDSVKNKIDRCVYRYMGQSFSASISCGMADVRDTLDFADAIHSVDKKLYAAKKNKKQK